MMILIQRICIALRGLGRPMIVERVISARAAILLEEMRMYTSTCSHPVINYRVFNFADNQFLVDQLFITPTPVTSTQLLKSTQYYKAF